MVMLKLTVCLLLFVGSCISTSQCDQYLTKRMVEQGKIAAQGDVFKAINIFDSVEECGGSTQEKYFSVHLQLPQLSEYFIGLCTPQDCTEKSIEDSINKFLQIFNNGAFIGSKASAAEWDEEQVKTPFEELWTSFSLYHVCVIITILLLALIGLAVLVENTLLCNLPPSEDDPENERCDKNTLGKAICSFSPVKNFRKLIEKPTQQSADLNVFHGVKVISCLAVVFGHNFFRRQVFPTENISQKYFDDLYGSIWLLTGFLGSFTVDIFFFISAFLSSNLITNVYERNGKMRFLPLYCYRYFRILPSVAFTLLFTMGALSVVGNGPIYKHAIGLHFLSDRCNTYWWTLPTFTSSIFPFSFPSQCIPPLWFLSIDMLYFLTIPVSVLLYFRNRKAFYWVSAFVIAGNVILKATLAWIFQIDGLPILAANSAYVYLHPWARIGVCHIGLLFGIFFFEYKKGKQDEAYAQRFGSRLFCKLQRNKSIGNLSFLFTSVCILIYVRPYAHNFISNNKFKYPVFPVNMAYIALARNIVGLVFGLFIVAPITGTDKVWNYLLNGRIWTFHSRLSFQVYVIHYPLIYWIYAQRRAPELNDLANTYWSCFTISVYCFCIGFFLFLGVEAPFQNLVNLLMTKGSLKHGPKETAPIRKTIEDRGDAYDSDIDDSDEERVLIKRKAL